jgi:uracil-DNA glycosylase
MIGNDWDEVLSKVWDSPGFNKFMNKVKDNYKNHTCFPKYENIFNALKLTPYKDVKIVIIGQDPYHGEGEAHGLSFSVQEGVKFPPSLQNIFKELYNDLGIKNTKGDLTPWAKEGVLLLNSILSVEKDKPLSHKDLGWQLLTDHIIKLINLKEEPVVFILWGSYARSKKEFITNKKHLIIESVHPSPLSASRGFFGSKPFSKANEFLKKNNIKEVNFKN